MGFFNIEQRSEKQSYVSDVIDLITINDNSTLATVEGKSALSNSDIYTGVSILSKDISSAEFKTNNEHIYDLLNKQNTKTASFNAQSLWMGLIANALLSNNGYAHIVKSGDFIEEIRLLKTSQVTVLENDSQTILGYKVLTADGKTIELDSNEVIHIKPLSIDGKVGISPLFSLKSETSMINNGNKILNSFFKKGVSTSGILKLSKGSQLNTESKKEIRRQFEEANSGAQNSGSVMVMDDTQDFKPFEVSYEILKMIQSNTYSTKQIAKALGIPLSRFGQELVNSSDTDANDIYITSTLHSWAIQIQQELSNKLNEEVIVDFSYLRGYDKQTLLVKAIEKNNGDGLLTINELRAFYDLPRISNGDEIYKNSASLPLNQLSQKVVN
ncbi:phage portal protein [Enterococcus sp. AZ102]|uniref:phage portal protein n=1 Tax=Enterococcus sp. AZ102 TaxID=2774865 RepID=UPI003F219D3C